MCIFFCGILYVKTFLVIFFSLKMVLFHIEKRRVGHHISGNSPEGKFCFLLLEKYFQYFRKVFIALMLWLWYRQFQISRKKKSILGQLLNWALDKSKTSTIRARYINKCRIKHSSCLFIPAKQVAIILILICNNSCTNV